MSARGPAETDTSGPAPGWIRSARPEVPAELLPWLEGAPEDPEVEGLAEAALEALERSEAVPGRGENDRSRAFHLLAADALLTYACRAALDDRRPVDRFVELARLASTGSAGPVADRR
ncbi:MAG: hypothetical protein PVI57_14050 [Gemmatimonadota bacterium]